jgi:prepilin-type N-terminal cleavage/methylation domain-containing protein
MNSRRGFTIIEVAMVMAILGILAAITLIRYQKTIAHNHLDKAAHNLYQELRSLRALSLKYNKPVIVTFATSPAPELKIYIDRNSDNNPESSELEREYELPADVRIGLAATYPSTMPYGSFDPSVEVQAEFKDDFSTEEWPVPTNNGLSGTWSTAVTVKLHPITGISYSYGGICISSSKLNETTYFIGITQLVRTLELFKTESTGSWIKL